MRDGALTSARRSRLFSAASVAIAAVASYLTVACAPPSGTETPLVPNPANNEAFFRQAAGEWDRLFNAANITGLMALYSPDVISMPFNTPTVEGIEAQRVGFEQLFAANPGAQHETFVDQIISTDDWAIERSRYKAVALQNDLYAQRHRQGSG